MQRARIAATLLVLGTGCTAPGPGPDAPPRFDVDDIVTARKVGLIFEVDSVVQRAPRDGVLANVEGALEALVEDGHIDKPAGVAFTIDEELPALGDPERTWTFAELDGLEAAHRTLRPDADVAVIHVVWVDGRYEEDDGDAMVLGFAWKGDSIVMLKDNVDRACTQRPAVQLLAPALAESVCASTERNVLLHEVGHLLGLVNNGAAMVAAHQDVEHGAHDVNEDCLMYWLNERSTVVDAIADRIGNGDDELGFDAACLDDLKAKVDASRAE